MSRTRREFLKGSIAAATIAGLGRSASAGVPAKTKGEKSDKEVVFQRRIPIRHEVDVFVAGGETA